MVWWKTTLFHLKFTLGWGVWRWLIYLSLQSAWSQVHFEDISCQEPPIKKGKVQSGKLYHAQILKLVLSCLAIKACEPWLQEITQSQPVRMQFCETSSHFLCAICIRWSVGVPSKDRTSRGLTHGKSSEDYPKIAHMCIMQYYKMCTTFQAMKRWKPRDVGLFLWPMLHWSFS